MFLICFVVFDHVWRVSLSVFWLGFGSLELTSCGGSRSGLLHHGQPLVYLLVQVSEAERFEGSSQTRILS